MRHHYMSPEHPRWYGFARRLEGPNGCNFTQTDPNDPRSIRWTCDSSPERTKTRAILAAMGFSPAFIDRSLSYFDEHGGHCDCEVLFNVSSR